MSSMKASYTVVVTGSGPYQKFDYNTTCTVRDNLPAEIKRINKPPITILKYPHPILCTYTHCLHTIPRIWSGKRSLYHPHPNNHPIEHPTDPSNKDHDSDEDGEIPIDLLIHMGMNSEAAEGEYVLEKRARRDGYSKAGEDGKFLPSDALKGMPEELNVGFDVYDVSAKMSKSLPDDISIKSSSNAGLYFCEFQLYTSLAVLDKKKEFARVEFLHIPTSRTEESIECHVKVAMALITECVDSLPKKYELRD